MQQQIGLDVHMIGELEHWFSCEAHDGTCRELLDVYVVVIKDIRLPPLQLQPSEKVDWVYFTDIFSTEAVEAGTIFNMEAEYRSSMLRRLHAL